MHTYIHTYMHTHTHTHTHTMHTTHTRHTIYTIHTIYIDVPNAFLLFLGSFVVSEESILKHHAADYIFDLLLHFITDSLAPCNDHRLDEVAEKLDNLWISAAVAVSIMRQILSQSDEPIRDSIMLVVSSYPSIFQDLFMIFEIGMIHIHIEYKSASICTYKYL